MARNACSCQGQLQQLASQQESEPDLNALISGGKRILHVSVVLRQMRLGVHAAAIAVGVTSGTHDLEGGAFVVLSDVLCSSGPWIDVRRVPCSDTHEVH